MRRAMSLGADRSVFAAGKGQDVGRSGSYPSRFFVYAPRTIDSTLRASSVLAFA